MFVWILSHVSSAIALSLFILKSSNLDKINAASYPNLSCGGVRILIAYNLKLALVPCATSEWPKLLRSFFNSTMYITLYPHAVLDCLFFSLSPTKITYDQTWLIPLHFGIKTSHVYLRHQLIVSGQLIYNTITFN